MTDSIQSLTQLLERASARRFLEVAPGEDMGLAEHLAFPFLGLVGQHEMKLALLLAVVNPNLGGVLLLGPRGTGKTTAARSLADLLPDVQRSRCTYGCLPEDLELGGVDAVCPDCAQRYGRGEALTYTDRVRLVELPLNARLEDVIGGLNERAAVHSRMRLDRGLLARADLNLLYVDEVNLLGDDIVDAILDAAAQGTYTVHRGPIDATYRARFVLIGSMNPEEGRLRPQILDRFGLRINVRGLYAPQERLEVYRRVRAYRTNPTAFIRQWERDTAETREEIIFARELLKQTTVADEALEIGLQIVRELDIDSHRAEFTLFEAARAHAAADGRDLADLRDIRAVAPIALRQRRSDFMAAYFDEQQVEDEQIRGRIEHFINESG